MRLAITGGAGFLGYHLCNQLKDRYEEIFILDIVPIEPREYPENAKFFNVDVRRIDQLNEIFCKVDKIVHAAAALPLWKRKDIFEVNINGTKNVLEAAKNNHNERVVYISSTAVYGIPKTHPIYEDGHLSGVGPYGESKIAAENICREYQEQGICVPIVRPKTFIGTGRLGVFQILYDWIASGKKIPLVGNGKNRYQLLEVEDLASAIGLMLDGPKDKVNNIFNVGAEEFKTIFEDVDSLCQFAKTGSRPILVPASLAKPILSFLEKAKMSPLYKWVYDTMDKDSYVSLDRIKDAFGWSAKYSNTEALINSYQWYLDHKSELKNTGITHRVAWKQGVLGFLKKFL
jgi:nucleoside-diphosphate-sugar epimerase